MLYIHCTILCIALCAASAFAQMATARVGQVMSDGAIAVELEAGANQGLVRGASVTLLREGEKIVHPLSGEVLGVPQEPVGVAEVRSVRANRSVAILVKTYSTPRVGDVAEYEEAPLQQAVGAIENPAAVEQVMERVRGLENDIKSYQKSQKTLSAYPVFAQQVWDEMGAIKSYLVTMDERLIELEAQQGEDRNRLAQVIGGESRSENARELTIRYSEDTDVRLQVAGKTLVISVERDSLHLEEVSNADEMAVVSDTTALDEEGVEEEIGWDFSFDTAALSSPAVVGGVVAFIVALTAAAIYIIKRRYDDVMSGLDDFDEGVADDEDFDEEFDEDEFEDDEDFEDEFEKRV